MVLDPRHALIARPVPLAAVPDRLLASAPFQSGAAWWRCVLAAGLPAAASAHLLLAFDGDVPVGLLPLRREGRDLSALVTPYTCLFAPVVAPGTDLVALGRAFGRACATWPVLRLDALDAEWPGWPPLLAGFAAAGWRSTWFDSFGNWRAAADAGWDAYLAACPGALRETIRRNLRRLERDAARHITIARTPAESGPALAAYESVYRRSWKPPEPFADFGPALIAEAAALGVLRLGVLWRDDQPLAAQYWIVDGPVATVLKLAHVEVEKAQSPGTVLTAWMVRSLLAEGVTILDFGRGDDPYKRLWADSRRQRKGLILARPWRPRGAAALARQAIGRLRHAMRARSAGDDPSNSR